MLLLDTHILIWAATRSRRLSAAQLAAIQDPSRSLHVSAVVAYEFTHLQRDRRIAVEEPFTSLQELLGFELVDLPANIWRVVETLPLIHRDPVDRMLVAHALAADMTLVTADRSIRKYPVPTI